MAYLSDLYKGLTKVTSINRLDTSVTPNVIRSISKVYKGSEQIWPKSVTPDPAVVGCTCWRDAYPPSDPDNCFDVTVQAGIDNISTSAPWNDQPQLRDDPGTTGPCVPKSSSIAYLLDEHWSSSHIATDPETLMQYNMYAEDSGSSEDNCHTLLGYFWRVRLNADETFRIFGRYDDSMYVRHDGGDGTTPTLEYFHNGGTNFFHDYSFEASESGWYEFQLFVGNRGGPAGPGSGTISSPSGDGIRYSITTSDGVVHGPFKIGYNKDSVLGTRFALPSDWRE